MEKIYHQSQAITVTLKQQLCKVNYHIHSVEITAFSAMLQGSNQNTVEAQGAYCCTPPQLEASAIFSTLRAL